MSENEHVAAIKEYTAWIRARQDIYTTLRMYTEMIDVNADALADQLAEVQFVNRQHEVLSIRVAEAEARAQAAEEDRERWIDTAYDHEQRQWKAEDRLAEAEARAGLQLERANRLAETILALCEGTSDDIEYEEGTSDDIEYELDLYPMDLRDQVFDLDAAPGDTDEENEHVAAIKAIVAALSPENPDDPIVPTYHRVFKHADALAAQLAEAEARAERWEAVYRSVRANDPTVTAEDVERMVTWARTGELPATEENKHER
jgi:chromosome segregation ATPase